MRVSYYIIDSLVKMAINFCSKENLTNTFYFAKNQTEQNCGCVSCIRRCCKPGFVYKQRFCYGNSTDSLEVSLYINQTSLVSVLDDNNDHFIVGVPKCIMFRLNFPEDEFYIQQDTKDVWIPKYNTFYNNNWYCVDELNKFTPFLCFSSTSRNNVPVAQKIQTLNTVGTYL